MVTTAADIQNLPPNVKNYKEKFLSINCSVDRVIRLQRLIFYYAAGLSGTRNLLKALQLRNKLLTLLNHRMRMALKQKNIQEYLTYLSTAALYGDKKAWSILRNTKNNDCFNQKRYKSFSPLKSTLLIGPILMHMYDNNGLSRFEVLSVLYANLFSTYLKPETLLMFAVFSLSYESEGEFEHRRILALKQAARFGNGIAMYGLGLEHLNNNFFGLSRKTVGALFKLSAETGYYKGMYVHGWALIEDSGGAGPLFEEGLALIKKAAELGYDLAIEYLQNLRDESNE